jgi:hypothetical protein
VDKDILTPIAPCSRCGDRYVEDATRDGKGRPVPDEELLEIEKRPMCESCQQQKFGEAVAQDMSEFIEHVYGLTAEDKKTLQALVGIIDNPDRVMMVARVQERVDELERRLEDRSNSLRDRGV